MAKKSVKKATVKKAVKKKVVAKSVKKSSSKLPDNKHKVQFKIYAPEATEVYLTGEFNKWSPVKKAMRKNIDGEWVTRMILAEGDHQYKFVVDGDWVNDPGASKFVDNGMGGSNSVRVV